MAEALLQTPVGPLLVQATERGLSGVDFLDEAPSRLDAATSESPAASALLARALEQIEAYFGGRLRRFDLPLDITGSDFQMRVWQAIASIPFGESASYAAVAAVAGSMGAYRAVGGACHVNPVPLVVPCHRVIASGGGLGGFGAGLDRKVWLLRHEAALAPRHAVEIPAQHVLI